MRNDKKTKINTALIPKIEARVLCATFLEAVLQFYDNPDNTAGFQRWQNKREGGIVNGQKDSAGIVRAVPDLDTT